MNWIELHTDTSASEQLSFLDGPQIVSLCANNGCTAVACTDRNSILSYLPMEQEAAYRGIHLLYGVTLDCADLDDRYAITLLAKNELGRRNIFALMRLLEGNQFPFGRCVTRQQVEAHREGLLLGASAIDGQLTRAIQLRRGTRRLQEIAAGYDYLEFPLEPYDTAAQLLQLSKEISAPLCAIRSARLAPNPSEAERHAFQAISYDRGLEERPSPYLPPDEVAEQFRALYVLPGERQGLEQALSQGQAWVMEQIAPLEPLQHLLNQNAEAAEMERQKWLRSQSEAALLREYGASPAPGIVQRFNWELERLAQLGMAGQVLLMQEIAKGTREAGGQASIAGPWNSSFLLYLLEITALNPLPTALDPNGLDLCPVSLLETGRPLLSAEMRLSEHCIPWVREKVTQKYGMQFLQMEHVMGGTGAEGEVSALIEGYLNDCCPKETAESLRDTGSFYDAVRYHSGRKPWASELTSLYLLPEAADPSALPIRRNAPEGALTMASFGLEQLDRTPCVLLLASPVQAVLARCAASTGVPFQEIPLDDEAVYAALGEAYRNSDTETPVAAACELLGASVNQFHTELFRGVSFTTLPGLIRFMSISHGTGIWQDNQQRLLQRGALCSNQLITCREDVYRYLLERGASAPEATAFMEYVRRGKAARTGYSEAQKELLQTCGAEDWFVQACEKICYLFPEGHSAEFALSLVRLVWYALHHPETAAMILEERSAST